MPGSGVTASCEHRCAESFAACMRFLHELHVGPPCISKVVDLSDLKNPLLVSVVERVTADMASHVAVDCAPSAIPAVQGFVRWQTRGASVKLIKLSVFLCLSDLLDVAFRHLRPLCLRCKCIQ